MLQNLSNIFSELLNFYTENGMTEEQALKMIVGSLIFAGAVLLALYVLKAVAIFLMAKKCGLKNKWMSFVPYLNFVILGKLAGKVRIFGFAFKNIGLFYAILLAASHLIVVLESVASALFNYHPGATTQLFYQVMLYVSAIVNWPLSIIELLCFVTLCFGLYGRYTPDRRILFSFLSCFNFIFPIILIAIHNKKPYESYDDYFKQKMAERYGQTYDPFSNPYETKENPFLNEKGKDDNNDNPFDEY
ncbi:MAG: hypothetical protein SO373_06950 [Candidatus Borkfalkiaceae bacterium]|nr:hypothetical protein [Christensenellaceae bacterium]